MDAVSAHLARIGAVSRPTGGPGVAEARRYCTSVLRTAGFAISEQSFEYSAFPASWAMPITGAVTVLAVSTLFLGRGRPELIALALVVIAVAAVSISLLGRRGVLDFPYMRRRGVNLVASRPDREPAIWLVAHLDSKWQPVSMVVRVAGVVGSAMGVIAMLAIALLGSRVPDNVALGVLELACLAAFPLVFSVVGGRNHGTLDNASGVAAVLEAAEALPRDAPVGVLISDAEEFALGGAHAWARTRAAGVALNCDSIDDDGAYVAMYAGARPRRLDALVQRAATAVGESVKTRRLIPGVLTDSVALADAGWETLTLSRGGLRTLQRIHTSRDSLSAMRGTGIAGAARILVGTVSELR